MIRTATPQDAPAIAGIVNHWIDATDWMPRIHSPASVERHYADRILPTQTVWVSDTPAQGFLALDPATCCISALYLTPDARGHGLGKTLLEAAKATTKALWLWTFQANTRAQTFYAANGFTETARTRNDNEEALPDIRYDWAAA